jgi:hypothetical protein
VTPNVAPLLAAIEKANSSAAERVGATISNGGSASLTRARASDRRSAADARTMEVRGVRRQRYLPPSLKATPRPGFHGYLTLFKQLFYTYVSQHLWLNELSRCS